MDPINDILKQVIDGSAMRHRALTNNIANADTPGYRRRDVSFISELRTAIQSGKPENIANVTPTITTSRKQKSIELEREFADLSENHLLYQTSVDVLSRRYARLRSAISGRV